MALTDLDGAEFRRVLNDRQSQRSLASGEDDYQDLYNAALQDVARTGLRKRIKSRMTLSSEDKPPKSDNAALVKSVMETSGGDNAALARKLHDRYEAVGLKQPSVEIRFDNLTLTAVMPARAAEGMMTVAKDFKMKAMSLASTATMQQSAVKKVEILHGVSGVLKPGRITLLLGPPGAGKSLFMKALCNRAPVKASGAVTYNGHTFDEFNVTRTARYIDQFGVHDPALTVRETLKFSARCQGSGYRRGILELMEERERSMGITPDPEMAKLMREVVNRADAPTAITLQLLSLINCADTVVGDGMTRGVSGGEKRRVTTGEMLVGPSKVLFCDEISTGLDSASTYTIVQSLANWAHATDSTIVVALLQPEPQTYDLFDDIMVLSEGHLLYHGERAAVPAHFASLGFEIPERKAVADFLQEIASPKDQRVLRKDPNKFQPSLSFVPSSSFAEAFRQTEAYARARATLDQPFDRSRAHPASLLKSKYGVTAWDALKALTWREQVLLKRNVKSRNYRYFQLVFCAFVTATIFLRGSVTNSDDLRGAQNALSVVFFSVAYNQLLGLSDCAGQLTRLPVFFRQRDNLFFPAWVWTIPLVVTKIPSQMLEVTYWSVFVYFVAGLETSAERFFCFWGTLFLLQIYSSSLYRCVASYVRAMVTGTTFAVVVLILTTLSSGFVLLYNQIPPWCIWMYWLFPLQYVLTALVNNEFSGESYQKPYQYNPDITLGDALMDAYGFHKHNFYRWLAPLILIGWIILLNILNMIATTYLKPVRGPPPKPPLEHSAESEAEPPATKSPHDSAHPNSSRTSSDRSDTIVVPVGRTESVEKGGAKGNDVQLPFEPVTLAFSDIHYYVPAPSGGGELELLKGITGLFRPGVLTALMGASGAGKSTLMDVLTDRKTAGRITGKVTVNGYDKDPATFARISGYCEQFDVHSPGTSVEEAVRFSAALRLPKEFTHEQHEASIRQTMELVELWPIAKSLVGIPGSFGLSGEQFKRLTIGVELVANPSIMFMDEPTSGLDARAAQIVMRVVRNIVNSGRTIVCTIHQPSTEIFFSFDEVLLLKRGGWTIYYGPLGPECATLVNYFQHFPGVKRMNPQYNPATYMLEVSTQAEEERLGIDFAEEYNKQLLPGIQQLVQPHLQPAEGATPPKQTSRYMTGRFYQYKSLLMRSMRSYWRSPQYNTTRLIIVTVAALLVGVFYWSRGNNYGSMQDVNAVMGGLFISLVVLGFINFQMVIPIYLIERPVYYRERAARMYSVLSWTTATVDVEVPWITAQAFIFSVIAYFMVHFEFDAGKFFFFVLVVWLNIAIYCYLGMLLISVTPTYIMSVTLGACLKAVWFIFAGFLIPKPDMPPWWQWMYYLTPPAWGIYALVADQLGDKDDPAKYTLMEPDGSSTTISQYIERTFDYEYRLRWLAVAILIVVVLLLRFSIAAAVKFLNFQSR